MSTTAAVTSWRRRAVCRVLDEVYECVVLQQLAVLTDSPQRGILSWSVTRCHDFALSGPAEPSPETGVTALSFQTFGCIHHAVLGYRAVSRGLRWIRPSEAGSRVQAAAHFVSFRAQLHADGVCLAALRCLFLSDNLAGKGLMTLLVGNYGITLNSFQWVENELIRALSFAFCDFIRRQYQYFIY